MAAQHCHCAQRNASAEMLGILAQLFVSVVEHVTVNYEQFHFYNSTYFNIFAFLIFAIQFLCTSKIKIFSHKVKV